MIAFLPLFMGLGLLYHAGRVGVQQTTTQAVIVERNTINNISNFIKSFFSNSAQAATPKNTNRLAPHSEQDLDTMARTIWGEARSEGFKGMQAVANVIMNRWEKGFSDTVKGVCLAPYQFSAWNKGDPNRQRMLSVTKEDAKFRVAQSIAYEALAGRLKDITNGADHYLNIPVTLQIRGGTLPQWADLNYKTAQIGAHTFLRIG